MTTQALRRPPEERRPAAQRAQVAQQPQGREPPSTPGEPSPAQILTEAFEDLRRRMVTIEGRLVSLSANPAAGEPGGEAPEEAAPQRPAGGGVLRALAMAVTCILFFGAGVVMAERVPGVAEMGRDLASWGEATWRDGGAMAAAFLPER
jgi:hypothetical protein